MVKFWLEDGLPMPHTLHTVGTLRAGLKKLERDPIDLIVLVTDGVTERMDDNDNMYGEQRLIEVVQSNYQLPASHLVETIFRDVRSFAPGRMPLDDVTALVVRCQGDGGEEDAE